jgi:general secretion pathway protein E
MQGMPMPGFSQILAMSVCWLLAEGEPAASMGLPFSLPKLILFVAWVNLCLYLVQRLESTHLAPDRYKSILSVATLFFGPLVFLVLVIFDATKPQKPGSPSTNILHRLRDAVRGIWRSRIPKYEEDLSLKLFDASGADLSEIYGHGEKRVADRKSFDLTIQIIESALQQRASDILVDPKDPLSYAVRFRVDGTLRTLQDVSSETARAVINSIKAVSSMDISERRRPQDGAFTAQKGGANFSFRVASAGALNGEKLSIRVLNTNASTFTLTDAGLPQRQCTLIANAISKPSGMVLVCGPTGSGKTTTLYSMLNQIDRLTRNVITVEDPIEAPLPEASQIEINTKAGITFAKALRSILRQDPDVICIGEIRDEETAEIALRAAQTGHLVLATIHCDSNAMALTRLLDLKVSPMLLSSGLNLLVSQRLMRKLCPNCKTPVKLSAMAAQGFLRNGIDTKNLFQPGSCPECAGTGYYGRIAICDILVITDRLRTEIANNSAIASKLRSEGEKRGQTSMTTEAIRLVNAGITSLEELKRVVG